MSLFIGLSDVNIHPFKTSQEKKLTLCHRRCYSHEHFFSHWQIRENIYLGQEKKIEKRRKNTKSKENVTQAGNYCMNLKAYRAPWVFMFCRQNAKFKENVTQSGKNCLNLKAYMAPWVFMFCSLKLYSFLSQNLKIRNNRYNCQTLWLWVSLPNWIHAHETRILWLPLDFYLNSIEFRSFSTGN